MLRARFVTANRDLGEFFDDHWVLKWFVLPILVMATTLFVLFVVFSTATMVETIQLGIIFLAVSFLVLCLGLGIEYVLYKFTGVEVFHSREEQR